MTNERVILTKEEYDDMMARMAYLQEELGKLLSGDNVSVSAREYGKLLYSVENAQKEIEDAVKKARKETASEIKSDIVTDKTPEPIKEAWDKYFSKFGV